MVWGVWGIDEQWGKVKVMVDDGMRYEQWGIDKVMNSEVKWRWWYEVFIPWTVMNLMMMVWGIDEQWGKWGIWGIEQWGKVKVMMRYMRYWWTVR